MTDSLPPPFVTVPPPDAETFAKKYLEGCYTYYTAPEEGEESITSRMEAEDEAMTLWKYCSCFPDVEPALLEAAFQEANGHLEQTVELLLTAMFFSSLETSQGAHGSGFGGRAPAPARTARGVTAPARERQLV